MNLTSQLLTAATSPIVFRTCRQLVLLNADQECDLQINGGAAHMMPSQLINIPAAGEGSTIADTTLATSDSAALITVIAAS